jgi:hypothetical protein
VRFIPTAGALLVAGVVAVPDVTDLSPPISEVFPSPLDVAF